MLMAAAYLRSNLTFLVPPYPSTTQKPIARGRSSLSIRCGRRDNRGPLLKGRVLSIEAIQAVQALKRAHRFDPKNLKNSGDILSRLIKSDLIATFKELLRQDQPGIALRVFSAVRSEYNPELDLYAELVAGLGRRGLTEEIDGLVRDLAAEEWGRIECDDKALVKLVRALMAAERKESTVRIYGLMKESGWGSDLEMDETVAKLLMEGFRRFGEVDLANEIDEKFRRLYKGVLEKSL